MDMPTHVARCQSVSPQKEWWDAEMIQNMVM